MYTIYSKPDCGFCTKAKALLQSKGLPFEEKILDVGQVKDLNIEYYTVNQLKAIIPNVRTVPQILNGDELIGGFDALKLKLSK